MTDASTAPITALEWGLKQSFRGYVEASGGSIETRGGATRSSDGGFAFVPAEGDALRLDASGAPIGTASFAGEVEFSGHGGMLSVFLADPVLEFGEAGGSLSVLDSKDRSRRIELATLDTAAITVGERGELVIPASLSMDGMFLLDSHYPPRTPLDPVCLTRAGG